MFAPTSPLVSLSLFYQSAGLSSLEQTLSIFASFVSLVVTITATIYLVIRYLNGGIGKQEMWIKIGVTAIAVALLLIALLLFTNCYPSESGGGGGSGGSGGSGGGGGSGITTPTDIESDSPFAGCRVGQTVEFGSYYIDSARYTEPIEWRVLDVDESQGRALIITRYGIDAKAFDESRGAVTWEDSSLRNWLNKGFYNSAFSAEEKAYILESEIYTVDYSGMSYITYDNVFCLSNDEADEYFPNDSSRSTSATPFAVSNGIEVGKKTGNCGWWLRTPGTYDSERGYYADCVNYYGEIQEGGNPISYDSRAARPAMYVSI